MAEGRREEIHCDRHVEGECRCVKAGRAPRFAWIAAALIVLVALLLLLLIRG